MYICPRCKKEYDKCPKFCGNCGTAMTAVEPAASNGPVYTGVFVLSICAFVLAVLGLVLSALFFVFGLNKLYTWAQAGMIIGFSSFAISAALAAIATVSSGKDRKRGKADSVVNTGYYLGVVSLVLCFVILSFSFANIYAYSEGPQEGEASGYFDELLDDDDDDDDDDDMVIRPDRDENSDGSVIYIPDYYGSYYEPYYSYGGRYDPYYNYGSYY